MSENELENLLNDFEDVTGGDTTIPAKRTGKTKPVYRSGLRESQTDRRQIAQVTGKKATVAGKYIRRSFTFRPDQLEDIEQVAETLGLSQNDLIRWFIDRGLEAVAKGVKPPIAEVVRHRYDPGR
jgi:hypothetical protein